MRFFIYQAFPSAFIQDANDDCRYSPRRVRLLNSLTLLTKRDLFRCGRGSFEVLIPSLQDAVRQYLLAAWEQ